MIARYCDMCGHEINRDYRKLRISTPDDEIIWLKGVPAFVTLDNVDLCESCAVKVIDFVRKNKGANT